jgi:hypothetical protein
VEITHEELRQMIDDAVEAGFRKFHVCNFNEEERSNFRDLNGGIKIFKRSILFILVGIMLGALGFAIRGVHGVIK